MTAELLDSETLRTLRPLDIVSYLYATGWQITEDLGEKASLWGMPGDPDTEVLVPKRQSFGDFSLRVSDILKVLSETEDRSQVQVFSDVTAVFSDLVRLRAADKENEQGTLSLASGVHFIGGAYDAMLAAACSTVVRRGNFPRRKPKQANEYMKRVRLGQTERGSFVLTLQCPVTPRLRAPQPEGFFPEEPFERKVTNTLMSGLSAVRNASQHAASTGDFAPFRESVVSGVSANLCAAILRLGEVAPKTGIEISMAWSKSRGPANHLPRKITIEPDSFPLIEEAARIFREIEPQDDFQLVGFIGQLRRPETDPIGRVVITGLVDDQARKVAVDLPAPQYTIAVDAHDRRKTISCTGELVKEGRSYSLLSPRDLRIIEDEEETYSELTEID